MAAMLEESAPMRVALIGRDDPVRAQLHSALSEAGAEIAYEADLRGVELEALLESAPRAVIVNLEPGSEDALDALDELLTDPDIQVVFNESEATSQLAGWDLARWARHLVAKVLGHEDANPPPPSGAERLPQRDLRLTASAAPRTPAQEVGEVSLQRFADEARETRAEVPASTSPATVAAESGAATGSVGIDEMAVEDDSPAPLLIERPDESAADNFQLDLSEIESSLSELGPSDPTPIPRRLGPDEPTVILSRSDLQAQLAVDAESAADETASAPRRLGPDEPTTVLDVSEVEASLAALRRSEAPPTVLDDIEDPSLDVDIDDSAPVGEIEVRPSLADVADEFSELAADLPTLEDAASDLHADEFALDDIGLDYDAPAAADDDGDLDLAALESSLADLGGGGDEMLKLPSQEDDHLDLSLDDDVAALAAQLESIDSVSTLDEPAEFDFSRREPELADSGEDVGLSVDAIESAGEPELAAAVVDAPSGGSIFGELSLADFDAEPAAGAEKNVGSAGYDFSSLNLSLEPTGDEEQLGEDLGADAPTVHGLRRVFVLGASIGGPDAVRTFLGGIPEGFPALFLLAQHLENGFFSRLAQQLQKATKLEVRVADDDAGPAKHSQFIVVPSNARFSVANEGTISRRDYEQAPRYKPCIDDLLRAAADVFGKRTTAIIFSGMAGDAVEGASYVASKGGEVWAQDPSSCVVSSMVDGAVSRGVVDFIGSPRELAERCVARYGGR